MEFNIEEYLDSLPSDTTHIDVSNKSLTYLPDLSRFTKLTYLNCSNNKLTQLPPLNTSLINLDCSDNQLTSLRPLNDNLKFLRCMNNRLIYLPNYNNLCYVCFYNNEIDLTIGNIKNYIKYYRINIAKKFNYWKIKKRVVNMLNNFRYTYYALKFKKQFKRWLWERVREPKIMKQFHPDHLNKLKESDDLEEFLEGWIKK
jgi:Leucine-rich repeat (LRR) protein